MKSRELQSSALFREMLEVCINDALPRLTAQWGVPHTFEDVEVYSWPQQWSDATCGFPGAGGQALTTAQTVVVQSHQDATAVVYHRGQFAYQVKHPGDRFYRLARDHSLPGAVETDRITTLEHEYDRNWDSQFDK